MVVFALFIVFLGAEPYPEQNRFDWLMLPSLQIKLPSEVQCEIPPFEPEQGCLPRAASAGVIKIKLMVKRGNNFLILFNPLFE